jgi:hypothetical protein
MTSSTIAIPQPTHWPRNLIVGAAAVLVALTVAVALIFSYAGHSTTHVPALRVGQSSSVSADCLVRAPGHAC